MNNPQNNDKTKITAKEVKVPPAPKMQYVTESYNPSELLNLKQMVNFSKSGTKKT